MTDQAPAAQTDSPEIPGKPVSASALEKAVVTLTAGG